MKTPILLILALLSQVALAQQTAFDGVWNCSSHHPNDQFRRCIAGCRGFTPDWTIFPTGFMFCPGSERGTPGDSQERCEALFAGMPPLCCPPGVPCTRDTPGPEGPSSSTSSSSRDKNRNQALIAGGIALFTAVLVKAATPEELPDGVQIQPIANIAYRDGLAYSSAALAVDWHNWAFSASSGNTGQGWSKPYARIQWTWAF